MYKVLTSTKLAHFNPGARHCSSVSQRLMEETGREVNRRSTMEGEKNTKDQP